MSSLTQLSVTTHVLWPWVAGGYLDSGRWGLWM